MSDWRDAWASMWFLVEESPDDRWRVNARIEHGQVLRFTVQYEARFSSRFYPVIRYDTAHGAPHRDLLDWDGSPISKKWFHGKPLGRAMTDAIADVKFNWKTYREEFARRKR